jgi:large subunit ribosomal protein L3
MTRVFTEEGNSVPVSVIEVSPNRVTQVKSDETDGYRSVQVTAGSRRASLVNKPATGHFTKAGVEAGKGLWELRLAGDESEDLETGTELKVDMFEAGEMVDVTGTSKGKGFAGTVKRHNFSMQDATHGNSLAHRVRSVNVRHRAVCSRARKWQVKWATNASPRRTWKSFASMKSGTCFSSRVQFPARLAEP